MNMAMGYMTTRLLLTAAELKVADQLSEGPKTAQELAKATKMDAASLYRLMRTLSAHGLFAEDDQKRFSLTALGEPLRTGIPGSVWTSVMLMAGDVFAEPFGNLKYSVETGRTAFEKVYGMKTFEYLGQQPEKAAMFGDLMITFHGSETPAIAAAYDFSNAASIVDIGGSTGNLIMTVLANNPHATGVVYDLHFNSAAAQNAIQARGMADRVKFEAGNFFEKVPAGFDIYLLSHIIHDWTEEECLRILSNCKRAIKPGAKLLIIEMVLPEGNEFHPGKMLDMIMLTIPGGQERTAAEYAELLAKAGFRMERVVPTKSAVSIVEAVVA